MLASSRCLPLASCPTDQHGSTARQNAMLLSLDRQSLERRHQRADQGLPRLRLRDVTRKFTFEPTDHEYREWQQPRVLPRVPYFYFNPAKMPMRPETSGALVPLAPRLFFENVTLSETTGLTPTAYRRSLG